jgi:REP element-mobilizing transposase RayT
MSWNRPPPPGFRGLDSDQPIHKYMRSLPHWRQDGASYFVTFRLADSLPQSKLHEQQEFRDEWERRHPPPHTDDLLDELAREVMQRVERWLDQGMGSCLLGPAHASEIVAKSLSHFHGERYELGCSVIMPNHVHAIIRPLMPSKFPLEDILQGMKGFTARSINARFGTEGPLWQAESFDRIIRDEEHLYRCIQYIGRNPGFARLSPGQYRLWINPEWERLGWGFDS